MGKQNAFSWMAEQGSATHSNRNKPMDGAMDGVMDRLVETESTHYLLHHDHEVIHIWLI